MSEVKGFQIREDEGYNYFMPVSLLPAGKDRRNALVGAHYGENKRLNVTFKTDREAVARLLPPGFTPTDPCTISVTFAECRDIDYMAGGGYNLVCVDASVTFQGERDYAEGSYALVLWMDKFYPILLGRELLGAAKLMAEVPDAKTLVGSGKSRFFAAEDGSRLVDGEVWDLEEMTEEEVPLYQDKIFFHCLACQAKRFCHNQYIQQLDGLSIWKANLTRDKFLSDLWSK